MFAVGFVKEANVSSTFPCLLINILWKFHLGIADFPKLFSAHLKISCAFFPLTAITEVKGKNAHDIFKWAENNFGKSAIPKWNFHKILINKQGNVEETYASFTKPTSNKIISKIEEIL